MAAPAIAAFGSALAKVGSAASQATNSVSNLGRALTQQLAAPITAVQGLIGQVSSFVEKANPGAIFHLNRAMDNMIAVIGQGLTPIVQGITIYLQRWGDVMAQMMPVIQPLLDQIGQSLADWAIGGTEVVRALAPFIELFTDLLVDALKEATRAIAFFQGVVAELITTLAKIFGLSGNRMRTDATAKGAAVYQPSVSGVEEFARKQFEQSLMGVNQNRGGGRKPEDILPEIARAIQEGRRVVEEIKTEVANIYKWLLNNKQAVQATGNAATKPGGAPGFLAGILAHAAIS
jgi:hypothetical protein